MGIKSMSDFTPQELMAIFAMQGFSGLSLFSVLLLMALGLAIIYGQMRVINMAHGEFMVIGAYATYVISSDQLRAVVSKLLHFFCGADRVWSRVHRRLDC